MAIKQRVIVFGTIRNSEKVRVSSNNIKDNKSTVVIIIHVPVRKKNSEKWRGSEMRRELVKVHPL